MTHDAFGRKIITVEELQEFFDNLKNLELHELMQLANKCIEGSKDHRPNVQPMQPFIKNSYRIRHSANPTTHYMGNPFGLKMPSCGGCHATLTQLSSIDLTTLGLDKKTSYLFLTKKLPFHRLPLVYCLECPGPIFYQVVNDGEITVFDSPPDNDEVSPFIYGKNIINGYLSLDKISRQTLAILNRARDANTFRELKEPQLAELAKLLNRTPEPYEFEMSQFGGNPDSYQGESVIGSRCINSKCIKQHTTSNNPTEQTVAVLDFGQDKFWGLPNTYVQIVFNICPSCYTIAAKYSCT